MKTRRFYLLPAIFILAILAASRAEWDVSGYGDLASWTLASGPLGEKIDRASEIQPRISGMQEWNIGVIWQQARDIQSIELVHRQALSLEEIKKIKIQYWFSSWPEPPPHLPSVEDQMDDPWQGRWLTSQTHCRQKGDTLVFSFLPLTLSENENAGFLPGVVTYRQSLKIRILYPFQPPPLSRLACFAPGDSRVLALRLQFGCSEKKVENLIIRCNAFNGRIASLRPWRWQNPDHFNADSSFSLEIGRQVKGIWAELIAAQPSLPGSADHTVVTVHLGTDAFSFSCQDVQKTPIFVPAFDTYVTLAADSNFFQPETAKRGLKTREKIVLEPEQCYERSRAEIPGLDPVLRDNNGIGDRLYLPLCADSHWQKFAVEWGGNFFMNKKYVRAKGKELARCHWPGDVCRWLIGTGQTPVFERDPSNCQMSILHQYLPVVYCRWSQEGLIFEEEAYATLWQAPLSPHDPLRDEQSPAFLMIRLRCANPQLTAKSAAIHLRNESLDHLIWKDNMILQPEGSLKRLRALVELPREASAAMAGSAQNDLQVTLSLAANSYRDFYFAVPFVSDISQNEAITWSALEYENEKQRVIAYWRDLVSRYTIYDVPEPKFNEMARAVLPHFFMSVWKDPHTGLYLLPAAALRYQIYANESCFQMLLLDLLGAHDWVSDYLRTFVRLQGSKPLPGNFSGSQKGVFYGARIDSLYDYTATGYNLHHGTVLWTLARHYLVSRDRAWFDQVASYMLLAADWIIDQRQSTSAGMNDEKPFSHGLLPAGRLEDNREWNYWFSVNAYACIGLEATAQAFALAGRSEAERLRQAAEAFRKDLRCAVKMAAQNSPVVPLRDHSWAPFVPTAAGQRFRAFNLKSDYFMRYDQTIRPMLRLSATREILYGPMILLNTGVIDAQDPMAEWILDDWEDNLTLSSSLGLAIHGWVDDEKWFSRGGMVFQANLQNPIPVYLMRREVSAAIRSIYNNLAACLYPDVNVFTEEYRTWVHGSGPFYKTPDEARFVHRVCDLLVLEKGNQLWLASGTPRRWLEPGNRIKLNQACTTFGQVSFSLQPGTGAKTISAQVSAKWHERPEQFRLYVRSPSAWKMTRVRLNGKEWKEWDAEQELIYLSRGEKNQLLDIDYQ